MKIGSLWMLVASMIEQSSGARGVDAILEKCAPVCAERKTRSKTNLSPRQGMSNTAESVSLKSWHVRLALENSRINTGTTGIFFSMKEESR